MEGAGDQAVGILSVITFPALGTIGRLGNHLFQMAATIGLALEHHEEFGFPRWEYEGEFRIHGCFRDKLPEGPDYREPRYCYDPIPYQSGLRLQGFFQSEKYFIRYQGLVRDLLTPKICVEQKPDTASVHVRRGDYLLLQDKHPVLGPEYYEAAVSRLQSLGISRFLVFSDDLPWCREYFTPPVFEVIRDLSPIDQLALTIGCGHHIMANSTFSWWGAWLDPKPGKIVIAPKRWFGPAVERDTKDQIPESWLVM
jgi:hypothetical protein